MLYLGIALTQTTFDKKSKIEILLNSKDQAYFNYNLIKGQGVKGLPEVVKKSGKDILKFNNINTEKPVFKDQIMVPLDLKLLAKSESVNSSKSLFVPVYYKAKKGETLFKIAKTINKEDVATFKKRNKLKDNNLKLGSPILLGWLPINVAKTSPVNVAKKPIVDEKKKPTNTKLIAENNIKKVEDKKSIAIKSLVAKDTMVRIMLTPEQEAAKRQEELAWVSRKGIAIWQQSHRKNSNKYVLHDKAPINSTILLYNPMAKRSIVAKVIGRIPEETYNNDIDIVLSSGAASSLGALDSRFMVEMKYKN